MFQKGDRVKIVAFGNEHGGMTPEEVKDLIGREGTVVGYEKLYAENYDVVVDGEDFETAFIESELEKI